MAESLEKWAYWFEEKAGELEVRMTFIKLLEKVTRNASGAPLQEHTLEQLMNSEFTWYSGAEDATV